MANIKRILYMPDGQSQYNIDTMETIIHDVSQIQSFISYFSKINQIRSIPTSLFTKSILYSLG